MHNTAPFYIVLLVGCAVTPWSDLGANLELQVVTGFDPVQPRSNSRLPYHFWYVGNILPSEQRHTNRCNFGGLLQVAMKLGKMVDHQKEKENNSLCPTGSFPDFWQISRSLWPDRQLSRFQGKPPSKFASAGEAIFKGKKKPAAVGCVRCNCTAREMWTNLHSLTLWLHQGIQYSSI